MKFLLLLLGLTGLSLASEQLQLAADNPVVLRALFSQFQRDNHRVYSSPEDARLRLSIFRKFIKEAAKLDAEQDDATLGVTFFADLTEEEKKSFYGANVTDLVQDEDEEFFTPDLTQNLQSTISWKSKYGAVKNQGRCASCWAFGAVGVAEGFQSIATGTYTSLSEQHALDCSGAGNCWFGGYHKKALDWIKRENTLASEADVPYRASKAWFCRNKKSSLSIRVNSVRKVNGGDRGLAPAIAKGPVAVLLYNFHGVSVEAYQDGVIPTSDQVMPGAMNHIVVAVGYTDRNWELRNSWGSRWGNGGYFWHSRQKNNNKGISDYPYTITYSSASLEEEMEEE